jgi:hypothetical protein
VRFKAIRKGGSNPADRRLENEANHALVILVLRPDQAGEIDEAPQCAGRAPPMFLPREPAAPRRPDAREPRGPESHNWRAPRSCRSATAPGSICRGSARSRLPRGRAMPDRPRSTRQSRPRDPFLCRISHRLIESCAGWLRNNHQLCRESQPRPRRDYPRLKPVA